MESSITVASWNLQNLGERRLSLDKVEQQQLQRCICLMMNGNGTLHSAIDVLVLLEVQDSENIHLHCESFMSDIQQHMPHIAYRLSDFLNAKERMLWIFNSERVKLEKMSSLRPLQSWVSRTRSTRTLGPPRMASVCKFRIITTRSTHRRPSDHRESCPSGVALCWKDSCSVPSCPSREAISLVKLTALHLSPSKHSAHLKACMETLATPSFMHALRKTTTLLVLPTAQ